MTLKLRLGPKVRRSVRSALGRGRKVNVTVTVNAVDEAGNRGRATRLVRIVR